ncbi:MAG: hypothetical protein IT209_10295 [Armatimonadetes bacterium]|nr:hypothetical protein [Armatimonadota bacterium]
MRHLRLGKLSCFSRNGSFTLLTLSLAALAALSGCAKPENPKTTSNSSSPSAPTTSATKAPDSKETSAATATEPGQPDKTASSSSSNPWSQIATAQKSLKSYTVTMDIQGNKVTQSVKLKDGAPVRIKSSTAGQGWSLMQLDKKVQYVQAPQGGPVMKMSMPPSKNNDAAHAAELSLKRLQSEKPKITTDTVDGVVCWKVSTPSSTAWIDKQYALPRQATANGKTVKMRYSSINSVPDKDFELPAGAQVMSMGDLSKQMEKMMGGRQRKPGAAPSPGSAPPSMPTPPVKPD